MKNVDEIIKLALSEINSASCDKDISTIRVKYLGRDGILVGVLTDLRNVNPSQRPKVGAEVNRAKMVITKALLDNVFEYPNY